MSDTKRPVGDDRFLAMQYAAGELDEAAAAAFERRLAADQAVRDALCAAVRGMRAVDHRADLLPDPAYRERVRTRLREAELRRRADARGRYRLHPSVWALAGAAAAALVFLTIRATTASTDAPDAPTAAAGQEAVAPLPRPDVSADDAEEAPELLSGQHLAQTLHEENRRKVRAEDRRIVRLEDLAARSRAPVYRQ